MAENITSESKRVFIAYANDAPNWNGMPLVGGNVGGSKEERGNLTQLKRAGLITDLLKWLNKDTEQYGVKVSALRFTNFAINQRTYRFLTDTALTDTGWE